MSEKLLTHRPALCNIVRRIAIAGGELCLDYFDEAGYAGAQTKADGSPVTLADQKVEELIIAKLHEILPHIPVIAEESCAAGHETDLSVAEYFWLIDPLDGTKEFIDGSSDYTVNIALIHKDAPVLGIIYAPALGELYAGYITQDGMTKAFRWFEDTGKEKDIHVRKSPAEGLTVISSRTHANTPKLEQFLSHYKVSKILKRGSSLKLCAVASGKADMYPRLGPTCEWDTAAGDAILRACGGGVRDLQGNLFTYGRKGPKFLNPSFFAASLELDLPETQGQ